MAKKYIDANKQPLRAGNHYLRNSDIEGINPLFYDGKQFIDFSGDVTSPKEEAGLFRVPDEDNHVSTLEKKAIDYARAALFMKVNKHKDVTSVYVGDEKPLGIDGG